MVVDLVVDVPAEQLWTAVVSWDRHHEWMLATRMTVEGDGGTGLGTRLEAFTGVGHRMGLVDPMVVTEWEPSHRLTVRHLGPAVRGTGTFEVFALPGERSRFVWTERLELPFGGAGRMVWPVVRPVVRAGARASLGRLGRQLSGARR